MCRTLHRRATHQKLCVRARVRARRQQILETLVAAVTVRVAGGVAGRFDSGITPPTHKITREFLRRKPHFNTLLRKRKYNLKSTFNAIQRAERHIMRVQVARARACASAWSRAQARARARMQCRTRCCPPADSLARAPYLRTSRSASPVQAMN